MSIGDDVSNGIMGMGKDFSREVTRFILDLIKMKLESNIRNKQNNPKPVKIPSGQVEMKQLDKVKDSGEIIAHTSFPNEDIERMAQLAEKHHISFAVVDISPGNLAHIAYPAKENESILACLKQIAAEHEDKQKGSLKFKENIIDEKNYAVTSRVLDFHDVPAYKFKTGNSTLAVVPKEFEQQFDHAVKEAQVLSKQLDNIDVVKFNQTADLDKLDYVIKTLPMTEAVALQSAISAALIPPDVKFVQNDENNVDIMYSVSDDEKISELQNAYLSDRSNADEILTAYIGDEISINKASLLVDDLSEQYFTRVPNTNGESYINLNKNAFGEKNGVINGKLDLDAQYTLLNKDGKYQSTISGKELALKYNGKSIYQNKDTNVVFSDVNSLERIELFNNKNNTLMKLSLDSSDNIRKILFANGYNNRSADILLKSINEKLPDEKKALFAYKADYINIKYNDISNFNDLKSQYQISNMLKTSAAVDVSGKDRGRINGDKVCIFDKNNNQYAVIPVSNKTDFAELISRKMNFDFIKSSLTADKVFSVLSENQIAEISKNNLLDSKHFDSDNLLLHNITYVKADNSLFLTADFGNKLNFINIDKDSTRVDVERAIVNKLGIKDGAAVAELMDKLDNMKAIAPCTQFKTYDKSTSINLTSSTHCSITNNDKTIYMPKNDIDSTKISSAFDISIENANKLTSSVIKALEQNKGSIALTAGHKLNDIISAAKDKFASKSDNKDVSIDKSDISRKQDIISH